MTPPEGAAPATIYALSSGRPPAAIAVVRISGPQAGPVLDSLAGTRPEPRRATVATLRDPADGELLDRALLLWMPAPDSVTGEDIAELHLHGGRAVVDGVTDTLSRVPGLRTALPGEFTRRALDNGRIDLNEAEGLADLLAAETQAQRRGALAASGGILSRTFAAWEQRLLAIAAAIEAAIDYSEEDDVGQATFQSAILEGQELERDIAAMLARPRAERLREGIRVVLAGPPNSGKSSLLNALCGRDAAIESPVPGTTRDLIEIPAGFGGLPFVLVDTAGLREAGDDIEAAGVERARRAVAGADIVIWLGDDQPPVARDVIAIHPRADSRPPHSHRLGVSAKTGQNLDVLVQGLVETAKALLPADGDAALNSRQHAIAAAMRMRLSATASTDDSLIAAAELRVARRLCDDLTGKSGTEEMLSVLFSRFCVGK